MKTTKLSFKGDKAASKPKKKRKNPAEHEADEPLEGWIDATSLDDVSGPVILLTSATDPPSFLCSSADSSLVSLRKMDPDVPIGAAEPDTVADVFVAKRVDPLRSALAFKTPTGLHLGSDKFGIVAAEREAVGPTEEWTLVVREDGFALQNVYGNFLKADKDAAPRGGGAVRADSDSVGFAEVWRIRCQAQNRAANKKKKAAAEKEDLAALEEETIKQRHAWGMGRLKLPSGGVGELREAKKEGKLNEALLDRRVKMKSDKFAK
ncbi:FRG1-like family-domain-containing protein [Hyaloraphidium curvatum]|nr:FRG1-like family-domain-containing protein [Hyaloraphidium curvatum]